MGFRGSGFASTVQDWWLESKVLRVRRLGLSVGSGFEGYGITPRSKGFDISCDPGLE